MFRRRTRAILASLMACALLFAQGVAFAQACSGVDAGPAMAFSAEESAEEMAGKDCHETVPANMPNPNACLQHCTAGDQTTTQVPAVMPDMSGIAVLVVPKAVESALVVARTQACEVLSPGPPPSLRFCSFQL